VNEALAAGPVLVHCASGNRTGAALIPFLMLDRGMSEADAVNEALRLGTRNAGLLEWATEFARSEGG
jgi:protein-tyrosine phosphatase